MTEVWENIKGYEGLYQVSNIGRVKALRKIVHYNNAQRTQEERIMRPEVIKKGYLRVLLCFKGTQKHQQVHRLVYSAFKGDIPEGILINHKDLDKKNNCIDNLELMTNRQNAHHYRRSVGRSLPLGVSKVRNKYKAVIQINKKAIRLGVYDTPEQAGAVFQKAIIDFNAI